MSNLPSHTPYCTAALKGKAKGSGSKLVMGWDQEENVKLKMRWPIQTLIREGHAVAVFVL